MQNYPPLPLPYLPIDVIQSPNHYTRLTQPDADLTIGEGPVTFSAITPTTPLHSEG